MDLESKLSEIVQLLQSTYQSKKIPLELYNDVFARIHMLIYISQDPLFPKLPDISRTLVCDSLDELKEILNDLVAEEDGFLQMAKQLFSQSNCKKLETMIPKLLAVSDRLIQNLTVQKYVSTQVSQKRKLESLPPDDEVEVIEERSVPAKKIRNQNGEVKVITRPKTETSFTVTYICHPKLEDKLPEKSRQRMSEWCEEKQEDTLIIKRDEFLNLPRELVVKISKEHTKIRGWKESIRNEEMKEEEERKVISYEITDTSINGTYYLGNKNEGLSRQKPMKLKTGTPFQLRNGDCVGILMDKEAKTNEMLIGFEFKTDPKMEEIKDPAEENKLD